MDEKDLRILEVLKADSSLSTKGISERTGIPVTTVHNRVRRLKESGIIRGYTVVLNHGKLGRAITAYVLMTVDYKLLKEKGMGQHELARMIRERFGFVEEVSMVTGESDMVIKIRVESIDTMSDFVTKDLRNIQGIERTRTMVVLSEM